jgi:hypothetical protein
MDITDALDSYLSAKVRVGLWEQEFNQKFYKPITDALINTAITNARNSPMFDQGKIERNLSPEALRKFRGE